MSKPFKVVLYQDNTQALTIVGLQDIVTGNYLNAATVTATLLDQSGNPVSGCDGISFAYQAATNGNYLGVVTASFEAAVGAGYTLVVDADQSGAHLHLEIPAEVVARTN